MDIKEVQMKTYTIEELRRKASTASIQSFLDWLEAQEEEKE